MIRSLLLFMFLLVTVGTVRAQVVIGGVVNTYTSVTSITPCDSSITVSSARDLAPGDVVLVMQMQGATVRLPSDSLFGSLATIEGAGATERLVIKSISGDRIEFTSRFLHQMDPRATVQLIRVARYTDAHVIDVLTAPAFDGSVGGVLAIECTGTLTLSADVNLVGKGFRGGRRSVSNSKCNQTDYAYDMAWGLSGERGEGIAIRDRYTAGRGRWITGGGGGNGNNAGGGGGSNGGNGGKGGMANYTCPTRDAGGYGGEAIASFVADQRFYLGGGGGGGHDNDRQGTDGAAGGGFVYLRAASIIGNANAIDVSGASGRASGMDGAGGGGAGGTVLLSADTVESSIVLIAHGGIGGDNGNGRDTLYNVHGPGGGGGGGVIVTNIPHAQVIASVKGGRDGVLVSDFTEVGSDPVLKHWGATGGSEGAIITSFQWKQPTSTPLGADATPEICPGDTATCTATPGFAQYVWSNGERGRVMRTTQPGTYSVTVTDSAGCVRRSNDVVVRFDPTLFTMTQYVDFGVQKLNTATQRTITFTSNDDDTIVISSVLMPLGFALDAPTTIPIVVAPFSTVNVVVSYTPTLDQPYAGNMVLGITLPCGAQHVVDLRGDVSPIAAHFYVRDTAVSVGAVNVGIPVHMALSPDSVVLPASTVAVTMAYDVRVFKLDTITDGVITNDVIDLIENTRTTTIRFDSLDLRGEERVLTSLIGRVLLSPVLQTPFQFTKVEWIEVVQRPSTTTTDGTLQVVPDCFYQGRAVRLFGTATITVRPIPASDVVTISATLSAPGRYSIHVITSAGQEVFSRIYDHVETISRGANETLDVRFPVYDLPAGVYIVRFQTPSEVITRTFPVVQ